MFSQTSVVALLCLIFRCIAGAQSQDAQVERFVSDTKLEFLLGERYKSEEEEGVLRRLKAFPIEAIQSALRLMADPKEDHELRRVKATGFVIGMYRTHPVPDSLHQQVASVIFREMIEPRSRPEARNDIPFGLRFFGDCGRPTDITRLVPLLQHSDPMIRTEAKLVLKVMAINHRLPDPTVAHSNTPTPPEAPPPSSPPPNPAEGEQASKPEPKSTPAPTPVRTVANANTQAKWSIAVGTLAVVLAVVWLAIRRPKSRKP